VDALVALARLDEATPLLRLLERRAGERGSPSALAGAARVRASLEAANGEAARADRTYRDGLELLDRLAGPPPFSRALLRFAYGGFLRRTGKRSQAVAQLSAAHLEFVRLDAGPYLLRCAEELTRCGLTPGGRGVGRSVQLTPQELVAARLAAKGLTNRQVARELVISVKTVEYHLGNVYAKLGVKSRTQLVRRLGLDSAAP
jgi:DNA-binding CsgD family transcriptional regulator